MTDMPAIPDTAYVAAGLAYCRAKFDYLAKNYVQGQKSADEHLARDAASMRDEKWFRAIVDEVVAVMRAQTTTIEFVPKRGDAVSFWLGMRVKALVADGEVGAVETVEALLAEYHWCADESAPLPATLAATAALRRLAGD